MKALLDGKERRMRAMATGSIKSIVVAGLLLTSSDVGQISPVDLFHTNL